MPFLIPFIPLIAAGAGLAASIIPVVAGRGGGGTSATSTAPATDPTAQIAQDQRNRVASIAQRLPDLQSQLGGSVSPDFLMAMASTSSGNPGDRTDAEIAMQDWLGLGDTSGLFTGGGGKAGLAGAGGGNGSGGGPGDVRSTGPNKNPFDLSELLSGFNNGGTPNDFVGGSV